jgi:mono/diheme cytochrome c family protein
MRKACLAGAIGVLMAVGVLSPVMASDDDPSAGGRAIAEQKCAKCHAIGREGASPHKDAPAFRSFANKWPLENLEEALAEGIVTGHPDMPAFTLNPEQIDVFIEYLHSLSDEPGKTDNR